MEIYLAAFAAIVFLNAIPAFAPPTWMALIFFLLHYELNPVALLVAGVLGATTGRGFLAWYFRKFAHMVPTRFSKNMEYAGKYLKRNPQKRYAVMSLFLISPVSSAQLFEAAGMMKSLSLRPLLLVFAAGRTVSYALYLSGAAAIAATNFGEVLVSQIKSPWAIAAQIATIAALVALGFVDWKSKLRYLPFQGRRKS